ncbi:hypothetical protein TVAG_468130 [Trichomonas vaginalis G3]|uniref:Uncharacterized protein n=1 Tax=Trichomonas vaginalis (strain ATCC PRA-98 / G3) TaxID=412133 RepID=A2E0Q2_TRIV3|nr:hypothetical protein TVAGG3_0073670 [Trichomonas vaginalis G3]EAY13797.1 hypothetical protein TVAG_468130 [Trichomonas vaginalis G3]KAI5542687.1 hypothetical protein TVAGG3_0073670 [Trichomonas vaginalis G3]|eukprot:XP_001326020.1 hypothetical protein [Trichomonas vaginalis G3]
MNFQSLQDRQELIEEIFDELEELILGRRNGSTDEIEDLLSNMNNNFLTTGPNNKFSNLPRTTKEWSSLSPEEKNKIRSRLLELLEEKKAQLTIEISNLDRIVQENAVER